jgi:hypothetical protein
MPSIFISSFIIYTLACFTIHILFNNNGAYMPSTITNSTAHNGAFIVTHSDGTQVSCHNLPTAQVEAGVLVLSSYQDSEPEQLTIEEYYGCELGGFGRHTPAITWTITGRVERCHNWATARTIVNENEKFRSKLS